MLNKQEIRLSLDGKYKKKRMELKEKFIIHLQVLLIYLSGH